MDEVSSSTDSGASLRRAAVRSAPKRPAPECKEAASRVPDKSGEKEPEKRTEQAERTTPARRLQSPAPELSLNVATTLAHRASDARIRTLTVDLNV